MTKENNGFDEWYKATTMTKEWVHKPFLSDSNIKSWAECAWDHQQERIDKLTNALKFYADVDNWNEVEYSNGSLASAIINGDESHCEDDDIKPLGLQSMVIYFGGKLARKTIAELKETE